MTTHATPSCSLPPAGAVQYTTVTTPGGDRDIFVFGSNLAGWHGAGAARYAVDFDGVTYWVR
jgi:hypothetical protein